MHLVLQNTLLLNAILFLYVPICHHRSFEPRVLISIHQICCQSSLIIRENKPLTSIKEYLFGVIDQE